MKMEMAVLAPASGVVYDVRCAEGRPVALGQALVILMEPEAETVA
jgi:urea carboxylase